MKTNNEIIEAQKKEIDRLRELAKSMRCCGNCKNIGWDGLCCPIQESCYFYSNWELKP